MKNFTDEQHRQLTAWRVALAALAIAAAGLSARAEANIFMTSPGDLKLVCTDTRQTSRPPITLTLTISQWGDRVVQIGRRSFLANQLELRPAANGRSMVFGTDNRRPLFSCRPPRLSDQRRSLAQAKFN